jgi:diguanylate cyclase (GGDEF)-like protein
VLRARVRAALQTRALRDLLEREALHDRLTGLPNRALIQGRIGDAVAMKRADANRNYALLFLDFDRFKLLNDTLGHEAGDELLRQIAQRMRSVTRATDVVVPGTPLPITARLGGDEFVVLLEGIAAPQDALKVAERLLQRLSEEFEIRGTRVVSTASIGIVLGDATYGSAVEVLRDADAAMYEAKGAGRGRCVVFDATMRARVQDRVKLERDLRLALEHEELFLEYQPIVSLKNGRMEGIEALLRWSHPQRGRVPQAEFVTLAEEAGLIAAIGEWALRRACLDFLALKRVMGADAPHTISVNASRQQLTRDFPARVETIVRETGMDATALRIEVTENGIMRDPEQAVHVLRGLKSLGLGIHVDDFGTGSSSLACLHQFPVDTLKIDRSFIANSGETPGMPALVTAIVQMARTLGIGVVAEGIETPEQLLLLQSMECEFGQGYLLGRPMPVERLTNYRRETPPALVIPDALASQGCAA